MGMGNGQETDDKERSGIIPANPLIPCHECGTEERFMTMKRDDEWTLEYTDPPHWVAFCPECDPS